VLTPLPSSAVNAARDLQRRGFLTGPEPGYAQHEREIGYQLIADDEWMALALLELQRSGPQRVASVPTPRPAAPPTPLQEPAPSGADPGVNGILTRVRGTYVSDGAAMLPPAGPEHKDEPLRTVELREPNIGQVRITYRLNTFARGRSRRWHWVAVRADLA
jgi:hypothetical protein